MDTKRINNNIKFSYDIERVEMINMDTEQVPLIMTRRTKVYMFMKQYFSMLYDIYFHLYGLMMFEIFFYLYYIVKIEKSKVIRMIEEFSEYSMNIISSKIDLTDLNKYIQQLASNPLCTSLLTNFETIQNSNIMQSCFNFIYFLNIFLVILTTFHICIYRSYKKLGKAFIKTIFFLTFCAIFEYIFFISIVMNYKILSKEESLCYFLNTIK